MPQFLKTAHLLSSQQGHRQGLRLHLARVLLSNLICSSVSCFILLKADFVYSFCRLTDILGDKGQGLIGTFTAPLRSFFSATGSPTLLTRVAHRECGHSKCLPCASAPSVQIALRSGLRSPPVNHSLKQCNPLLASCHIKQARLLNNPRNYFPAHVAHPSQAD